MSGWDLTGVLIGHPGALFLIVNFRTIGAGGAPPNSGRSAVMPAVPALFFPLFRAVPAAVPALFFDGVTFASSH
jgi:hypothetical protein